MLINIQEISVVERQQWLQAAIAPRPIAFVSTIDKAGNVNLSPFSFFNMVSTNPAVIIFSPSRRVRDNTTKHTLQNVLEVQEAVVHICDYDMVQQVSLSSCDFPKETDEFVKAGFTKQSATLVKPPMVKEAKVKMECKILEVKSLGDTAGAGQLVFAEVLVMHVDENILNETGKIDQHKFKQIARLGGDWYCVVNEQNLFKVAKPNIKLGIGIDALPDSIRNSSILTGNDLGQLANVEEMPEINPAFADDTLKNIIQYYSLSPKEMEQELHIHAKKLLTEGNVEAAWQILLTTG